MLSTSILYIVCYIYSYLLICTSFGLIVIFFENKKWISYYRKKVTKYKYDNSNTKIIEVLNLLLNKVLDEEGTAGFLSQVFLFFFVCVFFCACISKC